MSQAEEKMRKGKISEFSPKIAGSDASHAEYLTEGIKKSRKMETFVKMYAEKDVRKIKTLPSMKKRKEIMLAALDMAKKPEEKVKYNKEIANKIVSQVLKRLEVGSQKYGAEYFLADCIGDELYQELLDQVGWALINAVRWVEVFQKRFLPTDAIYWKKFMANQKIDFLLKLQDEVKEELSKRKITAKVVGLKEKGEK
jgi:hypothetical protein